MAPQFSFFDFPAPVRQRIYTYLLAPHPSENETVINYSLRWAWLENPSNTTFGGIPQIDLCRCPRQKPRVRNIKTEDHMYTRYKCYGPEVAFKTGKEDLWVPSPGYANSGPINFLRPARQEELERRPSANILSTRRTVYEEALPVLYRGRNFLFVTGPCPRGRYQAYATQSFCARLSTFARMHVTAFSLVVVPHEEDCSGEEVGRAYMNLVAWVQRNLPAFETLGINLWDGRLADTVRPLEELVQKEGVKIELDRGQRDGWVEEIEDVETFRSVLRADGGERRNVYDGPVWKEVHAENLLYRKRKTEVLLGKWRGKGRATTEEMVGDEDEWSDAILTPTSSTKDGRDDEESEGY